MSISAMKCALQSLESVEKVNGWNKDSIIGRHCTQSAHFLRQAIAEAEKQEPVGYFSVNDYGNWQENESNYGTPLYIAPVHTSDISQEPVDEMAKNEHDDIYDIWVEQKLKEKNVPQS